MARKKYFSIEVSDEITKNFSKIPYPTRLLILEKTARMNRKRLEDFCNKHKITTDMLDFWARNRHAMEIVIREKDL